VARAAILRSIREHPVLRVLRPGAWRTRGDPRGETGAGAPAPMSHGRASAAAAVAGAVVGLTALVLAVFGFRSYGIALFVGAPPIGGFVSGLLYARWHRPRLAGAVLAALLSLAVVVIAFSLEGLLCVAMALPFVVLGALIGAGIGCALERHAPGRAAAPLADALLLLPCAIGVEAFNPLLMVEPAPAAAAPRTPCVPR